ncbi:universal stress protein [Actinomadura nitritigenes]|uniref:universal stress protein n=1 Tax=Actinomadura nitritigenes TaxID=134602 RepID=UPI003D8F66C6
MGAPIVIGTDGSDEAARALDWAAAEAVLRERPLHIVHATESRPNTTPLLARSGTDEPTTGVGRKVLAAAGLRMAERSTVPVVIVRIAALADREISGAPVVDGEGRLVGVPRPDRRRPDGLRRRRRQGDQRARLRRGRRRAPAPAPRGPAALGISPVRRRARCARS